MCTVLKHSWTNLKIVQGDQEPGAVVQYWWDARKNKLLGIVVSVVENDVMVVWAESQTPSTPVFSHIKKLPPIGLIHSQLVGIQPMTTPSSLIFYQDSKYESALSGSKNTP